MIKVKIVIGNLQNLPTFEKKLQDTISRADCQFHDIKFHVDNWTIFALVIFRAE